MRQKRLRNNVDDNAQKQQVTVLSFQREVKGAVAQYFERLDVRLKNRSCGKYFLKELDPLLHYAIKRATDDRTYVSLLERSKWHTTV